MFGKPPPAPRARGPRLSFETLLAGRAMPIAGLLLVLLATAFFLDQAFRNGWIGPPQRILLGLVAGAALIYVAARRVGAEYLFLAEGLDRAGRGDPVPVAVGVGREVPASCTCRASPRSRR